MTDTSIVMMEGFPTSALVGQEADICNPRADHAVQEVPSIVRQEFYDGCVQFIKDVTTGEHVQRLPDPGENPSA